MIEELIFYWCYIMGFWIIFEKNKRKSKEFFLVDSRDWESIKRLSRGVIDGCFVLVIRLLYLFCICFNI